MADVACRRIDRADVGERGQRGERDAGEQRDIHENVQPQRGEQSADRRRAAEQQDSQQLYRAEEEAEAGHGDAAEARRALFADYAVERKHQR